jgi:hypothetical protein
VTVQVAGNEKDSITVLASVTADCKKLPLFAIAKGKTKRVEKTQLGCDDTLVTDHSGSGWTTIETFKHYLAWLAKFYEGQIPAGRQLHLILDLYSVHRSQEIKEYGKELGIRLWFIPAGFTDRLQPLDRAVFGAMKAMFRHLFERALRDAGDHRVGKLQAMQILKDIWRDLSVSSIHKGWEVYDDEDEACEDVDWEP